VGAIRLGADDHRVARSRINAPKHLTARSRRIYRNVVEDHDLGREAHALEVLRTTLEALDLADGARGVIEGQGSVYMNRFGEPRPRPEVAQLRDSRLAFWRGCREMALDGEMLGDVRVPRVGGGHS
jgi:hypothetical protein